MHRLPALLLLLVVALAACGELPTGSSTTEPESSSTSTTSGAASSTTEPVAVPGCEGDPSDYTTSGPVAIVGGPGSDAAQISSLIVEPSGECERFEVGLQTDGGAPATDLPEITVELLPDAGVIRLRFHSSVRSTGITESTLESQYVRQAYVVRGLDGALFIDLHVDEPISARAVELRNPARLGVEIRPGGDPIQLGPAVGERVVVVEPAKRTIEYPIVISGYARTFEANVLARVASGDSVELELVTTAADWLETWGEFRLEVPEGPGGDITIFVGEESPEDGTPSGVTIEVSAG